MLDRENDFLNSIDANNKDVVSFVPYLLQDLWALGSVPEIMVELFRKHQLVKDKKTKIVDFPCGKGAVITKLAQNFPCDYLGIDIFDDFIKDAEKKAKEEGVGDYVSFRTENIYDSVHKLKNIDIAIFGYDTEILGDIHNSILSVKRCLKNGGKMVFDSAFVQDESLSKELGYSTYRDHIDGFKSAGVTPFDEIKLEKATLVKMNDENTQFIRKRAHELINKYPHSKRLFEEYLENQIKECEIINRHITCTTWLLS